MDLQSLLKYRSLPDVESQDSMGGDTETRWRVQALDGPDSPVKATFARIDDKVFRKVYLCRLEFVR